MYLLPLLLQTVDMLRPAEEVYLLHTSADDGREGVVQDGCVQDRQQNLQTKGAKGYLCTIQAQLKTP